MSTADEDATTEARDHMENELQHNGFADSTHESTDHRKIHDNRPAPINLDQDHTNDSASEISDRASHDVPRNGFFSPDDVRLQEDVPSNEGHRLQEDVPTTEDNRQEVELPEEHIVVKESVTEEQNVAPSEDRPDAAREDIESVAVSEPSLPVPKAPVQHRRPSTLPSMVFVVTALENIAASKEARKRKQFGDAAQTALNAIKKNEAVDPEVIFEPLRLATETGNTVLTTTALDCIGKLITYSYFAMPDILPDEDITEKPPIPLIERAIDTICDCFQDETTSGDVQLQIMKSLLAAVLNDKIIVHGAGLLKAVRQVYNIFLLSRSVPNQQVAQGTLTQMVGTVFERVKFRLLQKEARLTAAKPFSGNGTANASQTDLHGNIIVTDTDARTTEEDAETLSEEVPPIAADEQNLQEPREKMTLQSFENAKNFDDTRIGDNVATTVTRASTSPKTQRTTSGQYPNGYEATQYPNGSDVGLEIEEDEDEIYVKDAFLVFRSMCRLSTKVLQQEQLQDLRSQNMRSKLVSLSILRTLMNNNMEVFTSPLVTIRGSANEPTSFGQAINQYLRLAISRNGSSAVRQVFETSCEIFWLILKDMRVMLKREIEVFFKEIYFAILERKNAPQFQKLYIMKILRRLANDPRALVEMYLNYDCDRTALDNMFQKMIEILSKFCAASITVSPQLQQHWQEIQAKELEADLDWRDHGKMPPPLTIVALAQPLPTENEVPMEFAMKQNSLESLVRTLRSLVAWSQDSLASAEAKLASLDARSSLEDPRKSLEPSNRTGNSPRISSLDIPLSPGTPLLDDDPNQLEKVKQRKTALMNGIQQFNFKPKRGIKVLKEGGFITDDSPESIAIFILNNEDLDKAMIGEYLGEGEPQNVAIMHAFVDQMDFGKRGFVDSLRQFLQSFRLPGEAQKIDRFMLKFAERYMTGNPGAFANADTAYVLAYSVILLNTDLHSTKMKGRRMTLEDFVKNNRGINDNADLPEELLREIYDEIAANEIVLNTERAHAAAMGLTAPVATGITSGFFSRDLESEAAHQADQEMSSKTEQRLKMMLRGQKRLASKTGSPKYIPATSFRHAGSMFDVTWMSFLSGFSGQMQNISNLETLKTVIEGLKLAIKLSCIFDLETPRVAFVTYLANLTNLSNPREMQAKNLEALRILLELALSDGNMLKTSWVDVLTCVSQIDRLQLITGGLDEDIVPDVRKGSIIDSGKSTPQPGRRSMTTNKRNRPTPAISAYQSEIMQETTSSDMIRTVDRIFSGTAELNGDAIVHFARALSEVSWNEIQSSGHSESPRMYSLQKLVEISYYNMGRVRFEWTNIWQILGEHFNEVGCHNNTNIVFFALDSLRQLSKRFMEIEELPGFKFQKDFLKPFEHVIANSTVVTVKDMVLRCLIQMIQANGDNIRSGWKTMFGVFTVAAREPYEALVNLSFDQVNHIYNTRFGVVIAQGAFADLVVCLTEFSKNLKFQKKSLQAIETLKSTVPRMLKTPECPLYQNMHSISAPEQNDNPASPLANRQTQEEQYWFPVLFAFHDVLMTGEDLEVRSQALNYLFDTLIKYGGDFPPRFWDTLWRQLLYPIFMVLRSRSEMTKVLNHEDLSVWLSTTMIQALRNMMALFTHYFDSLEYMLDKFLDLLALCICQENDTIARIGSNCLQTLILQNVTKFQLEHWHQIVTAFVTLFERTTAHQLFTATNPNWQANANEDDGFQKLAQVESENTTSAAEQIKIVVPSSSPKPNGINGDVHASGQADSAMQPSPNPDDGAEVSAEPSPAAIAPAGSQQIIVTPARRRYFNKIITKCVLQLLMIETVNELFSNNEVYAQIPSPELLRLMALLKKSYVFAKKFNSDNELRRKLFQQGFMKQPPNLLKQESGSAASYVSILVRMYFDDSEERQRSRADTENALIPLCVEIIRSYIDLDDETQHRNIVAWKPVVIDIIESYTSFPPADFDRHIDKFYELAVDILNRDLGLELRVVIQGFFRRVGEIKMNMAPLPSATEATTPGSPRSTMSPRSASSAFFARSTNWTR